MGCHCLGAINICCFYCKFFTCCETVILYGKRIAILNNKYKKCFLKFSGAHVWHCKFFLVPQSQQTENFLYEKQYSLSIARLDSMTLTVFKSRD